MRGGLLGEGMGVAVPGRPTLTEKDIAELALGAELGVATSRSHSCAARPTFVCARRRWSGRVVPPTVPIVATSPRGGVLRQRAIYRVWVPLRIDRGDWCFHIVETGSNLAALRRFGYAKLDAEPVLG